MKGLGGTMMGYTQVARLTSAAAVGTMTPTEVAKTYQDFSPLSWADVNTPAELTVAIAYSNPKLTNQQVTELYNQIKSVGGGWLGDYVPVARLATAAAIGHLSAREVVKKYNKFKSLGVGMDPNISAELVVASVLEGSEKNENKIADLYNKTSALGGLWDDYTQAAKLTTAAVIAHETTAEAAMKGYDAIKAKGGSMWAENMVPYELAVSQSICHAAQPATTSTGSVAKALK